jgi:sodium/proline symporter
VDSSIPVLATLVIYNAILICVGIWARRRNQDIEDFYLGGRRLGPWVGAISASASSSSAWTLLGVSGAAYAWGLPALWIFPATLGGFIINWFWVGPRLRELSFREQALTVNTIIAPKNLGASRRLVLRVAAGIIVFCFVFYVASQFEAAGKAFESVFGLSREYSILAGAAIVLVYTLLGGFWAVSVTDTVQGLLMCLAAIILPLVCVGAIGGIGPFIEALAHGNENAASPVGGMPAGLAGLFFALGILGIGIGYPGQPHVVNRFMAIESKEALRRGRVIALSWAVLVYSGMLILGLSARVLIPGLGDSEVVLFAAANQLLPAVVAGIVLAAVLSAIMSTADSQLLVASSAISYDWRVGSNTVTSGLGWSRATVVVVLILSTILALVWRADIFSRVLFAWSALGSAFGPLLLLRLSGRDISAAGTLAAMLTGFGLTVIFSLLPDTPGDVAERWLPFLAAGLIAVAGRRPAPRV